MKRPRRGRRGFTWLDVQVHRLNDPYTRAPIWVQRLTCWLRGDHGNRYYEFDPFIKRPKPTA